MNDMVDMSQFIEAKSDQLNADDLIGGPRTVTVTRVVGTGGDQPVSIFYQGDNGKPFKPCKTIRRVLMAVWGRYANEYVGKSMTLYRDDKVTFGGLETGGIRISHMSHIEKKTVVVVMKTKGKKAGIEIHPLAAQQEQKQTDAGANKPDAASTWASGYIVKLGTFEKLDEMRAFETEKAGKLAELKDKRPELHKKVTDAIADTVKRLSAGDPFGDDFGEGPSDEQRGEAFNDATAQTDAFAAQEAAMACETVIDLDRVERDWGEKIAAMPPEMAKQTRDVIAAERKRLAGGAK